MANVISGANYSTIATNYANARDKALGAVTYLFEAVYQIVLLNDLLPEVDLLQEFYNAYLINNDLLKSPVNFLPAVRALNNHVLSRGTSTSVDDFLTDEAVTVPQTWATLSESAGFEISPGNISG
jgi:hypothetical protein